MNKFLALLLVIIFSSGVFALTSINAPAVDSSGKGVLTLITADVKDGSGSVYLDVQPYISVDTQESARTAFRIAAEKARVDFTKKDIFFKVKANSEVIDGPSGGAALTLLSYAELTGKKFRNDFTVTGTIEVDGSIGKIGGVLEKLQAARDAKLKLFLLPVGQAIQGNVDLVAYGEKWGIQVVEVKNVNELLAAAYSATGSKIQVQERVLPPLILEKLTPTNNQAPLKELTESELSEFNSLFNKLKSDPDYSVAVKSFGNVDNQTRFYLSQGYYYTAANNVFVNKIQVQSLLNSNLSKSQFKALVQELDNDLKKISFPEKNNNNFDLVAAAQLRYYWAKNRLDAIKKDVDVVSPIELSDAYYSAKNWFSAAQKMSVIASKIDGTPVNELSAREYAKKLISDLNVSNNNGLLDPEEESHLNTAVLAFSEGNYYAASFDALYASSFAIARKKVADNFGYELKGLLKTSDYYNSGKVTGAWPEYYFVHSLYQVAEYNRTSDFAYFTNAIKLQELSSAWMDAKALFLENPRATIVPKDLQIDGTITVQKNGVDPSIFLFMIAFGVIGIIAVLIFIFLGKTSGKKVALSIDDKLAKLDDLLIEGKISEKTYQSIKSRYSPQKSRPTRKASPSLKPSRKKKA